jgi:hypothetical protein
MKVLGESVSPWMQRRFYDPTRGMTYEWTKTGTIDAIRAVEASLAAGTVYEVDESSPPGASITIRTPEATDGNNEGVISVNYELSRNITQRSGYEHKKTLALSPDVVRTIRSALKDNQSSTASDLTGNASTFYGLMLNGQDSYITASYVFRMTQMVSRNLIVDIAFEGAQTIYSSTGVKNETNPGSLYENAIDEAYASVLNGTYQGSIPSGYTLGWLKQAPTISTVSGNKSAVVFEYWLEAWSTYYYA